MRTGSLSRTAYLTGACIVLVYMLAISFKSYVFYVDPPVDTTLRAALFKGSCPLYLASSAVMLIASFVILYPFIVICVHNFPASPTASVAALLGMFFFFGVKICLLAISLFRMQMILPDLMMEMNGPGVQEGILGEYYQFLKMHRYLDFPVTVAGMVSSILLLRTFSSQYQLNRLIKLAFGVNLLYLAIHFGCLLLSLTALQDYNRTLCLPVELLIYGLIFLWLISAPTIFISRLENS
ncbi:hypothetical protein [Chitinophaga eiseniae]|uniref:DUF4386 domain-containing protein n=1 Tax=Chitinophaga eiseniae TaxID=634771 RepID=A0A847SGU1_9BACT|nr:hypothetical protein [Chitinophaga eiseniae]NLR81031.1 hypothetical protein [Chitinophaga eiseniae]